MSNTPNTFENVIGPHLSLANRPKLTKIAAAIALIMATVSTGCDSNSSDQARRDLARSKRELDNTLRQRSPESSLEVLQEAKEALIRARLSGDAIDIEIAEKDLYWAIRGCKLSREFHNKHFSCE